MKRVLIAIAVGVLVTLCYVPQASADAFLNITVGGTSVTCNTSLAVNAGTNCLIAQGFTAAFHGNGIQFTGTVNGFSFLPQGAGDGIVLSSNNPGSPTYAFVLDSKAQVTNISNAVNDAVVDFGVNNFTQPPTGPLLLSASHSGTGTNITNVTDNEAFRAWERNDNGLVAGGGGATATAAPANCVFPGTTPPARSCNQSSGSVALNGTVPFSLTGQETIHLAVGDIASFQATSRVDAVAVPEPASVMLLGTGLLFLAGHRLRRRSK